MNGAAVELILAVGRFQDIVYQNAKSKGWHDKPNDPVVSLALIHCEASEAVEAIRHGNPPSEHIPRFSGVEEELADIVIRCMDLSQEKGYRLGEAIVAKHEFNRTRPIKHGGKLF
jgi:NTP pyrophosphatase (non-canonical NTP hydrolase)